MLACCFLCFNKNIFSPSFFTVTLKNTVEKGEWSAHLHGHKIKMLLDNMCGHFPGCLVKLLCIACAFSGLSTGIPCLFCDVLLDLLEVHIHTPFITMQKGIKCFAVCHMHWFFTFQCAWDNEATSNMGCGLYVCCCSSSSPTQTNKDMRWKKGQMFKNKSWLRLRGSSPFSLERSQGVSVLPKGFFCSLFSVFPLVLSRKPW